MADDDGNHMNDEDGSGTAVKGNLHYNVDGDRDDRFNLDGLDDRAWVSLDEEGHLHHGVYHDVDDDGDGIDDVDDDGDGKDDDGNQSRQTWTKMVLARHWSALLVQQTQSSM